MEEKMIQLERNAERDKARIKYESWQTERRERGNIQRKEEKLYGII